MGTPETYQEQTCRSPCPDRALIGFGGAFGIGAVGGCAFHFLKGLYNSPNGERMVGGVQAVRMNAPRVGGTFAVCGGLFSTLDCTMFYVRQKEDLWNSIIAGAATGGILSMRRGLGAASMFAMFGGVTLALIEGASSMIDWVVSIPQNLPREDDPTLPQNMPPIIPNSTNPAFRPLTSSSFGRVFGGGIKKDDSTSRAPQQRY